MKHLKLSLLPALALSVAVLGMALVGCATQARRTEDVLKQCGFKTVAATNAAQQKLVKTLPPGRISHVVRKKKDYYVFPDHARNLLYVGTAANLHTYKEYLSDQQLRNDAKDAYEVYDAPRLATDAGLSATTGNVDNPGGWNDAWYGWDERDAY